jgi:hypothetical protein
MFLALLGGKPRKKEKGGKREKERREKKREEVGSQTRSWGRTRSQTDYDISSFAPSSLVQLVSVLGPLHTRAKSCDQEEEEFME